MAELSDLAERLLLRFKDVPNVTIDDAMEWIERSLLEHGIRSDADVPDRQILLVLLYAEWDACLQMALNTAYYFEYKDGEETVDKRNISDHYRKVAVELKKRYDEKKAVGSDGLGGSRFTVIPRVDRL